MIEELELISFGKFKNKIFRISPLHFFQGKNESGKSTIFDAILYKITSPKKNSIEGRRIHGRYGDSIDVEIKGDITGSVDIDEFLNLHCLKSGEIMIDFSKDKWVDNIKKQLFSGGIDPKAIGFELEKASSGKGSTSKSKIITSLREKLRELESDRDNLLQKKDFLLSGESKFQADSQNLENLKKEIIQLEKDWKEKNEKKEKELKIQQRKGIYDLWLSLSRKNNLQEKIDGLKKFSDEKISQLNNIEKEKISLREKKNSTLQSLEILLKKIEDLKSKIKKDEEIFHSRFTWENLARNLKDRIEENLSSPFMKEVLQRDKNILNASLISLSLGILLISFGFFLYDKLIWLGSAFVGLTPILFFFSQKKKMIPDMERTREEIAKYKREWKEIGSTFDLSEYTNLQSLRDYFFQFLSDRKSEWTKIQKAQSEITQWENEKNDWERKLKAIATDWDNYESREKEILHSLQLSSREELIQKNQELHSLQSKQEVEISRIKSFTDSSDWEALEMDLKRKLDEFDKESIQDSGMDDSEFNSLQKEIQRLSVLLKDKNEVLKDMEIRNVKSRTSVETQLEPISKLIFEKQTEFIRVKDNLQKEENNLKAMRYCSELFMELGTESDNIMDALSREIQGTTGSLFPSPREIRIQDLKGNIEMQDETGNFRSLGNLSLGTRDLFYIAAKMALCEKNDPHLKLFLMDEPFASLDEERSKLLVGMIQNYTLVKGWQVIVFSKDPRISEWFGKKGILSDKKDTDPHFEITKLS